MKEIYFLSCYNLSIRWLFHSLNVLALCEKHFLVKMIKQAQVENEFPSHIMTTEVVLSLFMDQGLSYEEQRLCIFPTTL